MTTRFLAYAAFTTATFVCGCSSEVTLPDSTTAHSTTKPVVTAEQAVSAKQLDESVNKLLDLMQRRMLLMHDVARWKWNESRPASDPKREQQLLDRLAAQASEHQLDAGFVREFFQAQMNAAKLIQQADFDKWQAADAGPFPDVPSLADKLRPAITELSEQLLRELAVTQRHRGSERLRSRLTGDGISDTVRAAAIAPLIAIVDRDKSRPTTRDPDTTSATSQE